MGPDAPRRRFLVGAGRSRRPEQLVGRAPKLKHSGQPNPRPNQHGYCRIEERAMRDHDEDGNGDRCERDVDVTQVVEIRQPDGYACLLPGCERSGTPQLPPAASSPTTTGSQPITGRGLFSERARTCACECVT
jgi:hypothetical protein